MKMFFLIIFIFLLAPSVKTAFNESYTYHPCIRPCNGTKMICRYTFYFEAIRTLEPICENYFNTSRNVPECVKGDGTRRTIAVVNRQLPGPSINVCQNDTVEVKLINLHVQQSVTLHWHGVEQKNNAWNDGVPMVTQCPIVGSGGFVYRFKAETTGTKWYHGHVGTQRADGLYGKLNIRERNFINSSRVFWDLPEHTLILGDWQPQSAEETFLIEERYRTILPDVVSSLLIDGNGANLTNNMVPNEYFVKKNNIYRFRVVNAAAMSCPMELTVQNHPLKIISSDGNDVEHFSTDSLVVHNGERWDFLINANQKVGCYIIRVEAFAHCENRSVYAVLRYQGAPPCTVNFDSFVPKPNRIITNCFLNYTSPRCIHYPQMKSVLPIDPKLLGPVKFYYPIGLRVLSNPRLVTEGVGDNGSASAVINSIAHTPPRSVILLNPDQPDCNATTLDSETPIGSIYECLHRIHIKKDIVFELIFIDEGYDVTLSHPGHYHGYTCAVVAQEKIGDEVDASFVMDLYRNNGIVKNLNRPIMKDTVFIPDGGFTIVRCFSSNPGQWLLHCHVDYHVETGMQLIMAVEGELQIPKDFPNYCGPYEQKEKIKDEPFKFWWW